MSLLTPLIWVALMLPLFVAGSFITKQVKLLPLVLFAMYFLLDSYIQILAKEYLSLNAIGIKFAWTGKLLSLLLSLIIVFSVSKADRRRIGFTKKIQSKKQLKFGVLVFIGFLLFDFVIKLILFPKGESFDLETFVFQATMPGLTEEIALRGIGLWILNKAYTPNWKVRGVKFGWGFIVVTVLFAVAHGAVLTSDCQFKFDLITIIYLALISSFSLGILRAFSGNLIFPILGHNMINLLNAIIRIL